MDHILSINKTNIEVQKGDFSSWYENKERLDQFERSENERLKKDISRLETAARQSGKWADKVESTKIGKKSWVNGESVGKPTVILVEHDQAFSDQAATSRVSVVRA